MFICPKHELFLRKAPQALFEKAVAFWQHRSGLKAASSGRWTASDWLKLGSHKGAGIWFCPPLISCKESCRKNKRWAARNNVALSRSAERPNPSAAGLSCARSASMEEIVWLSEICFHILVIYLEIHRFASTSSQWRWVHIVTTALMSWNIKSLSWPNVCLFPVCFAHVL